MLEALILTLAGAALGLGAGLAGLFVLSLFATWAFSLTFASLVIPLAMGTVLGVGFGFYPALRASRLDPIEALR